MGAGDNQDCASSQADTDGQTPVSIRQMQITPLGQIVRCGDQALKDPEAAHTARQAA